MQQRNFIWFMVLSLVILIGWQLLMNAILPPQPKPKTPTDEISTQKLEWKKAGPTAVANLIANRGLTLGTLFDEIRLSQDLLFPTPEPSRSARWTDLSEMQRKMAVLLPPPLPTTLGVLAHLLPKKSLEPEAKEIAFGDKETFLQGMFTTRGAGVCKLTLNKFKAANRLGEPAEGDLDLIPYDPEKASFLMVHYPADVVDQFVDKVDEDGKVLKKANPVDTLARQIWKLEDNKTDKDGTQEIRFSTEVPEEAYRHVRIFKTYRLGKRDYHLTLILEFQDERPALDDDAKPVRFRYQLAGAHGLPIEGTWYAPTYRDSVIGMVDGSNNLYRFKEDAAHIGFKKGGEPVPDPREGPGEKSFLQYAGTVTQFFASVIVVDQDQTQKKILQWARPTVESEGMKGILKEIEDNAIWVLDVGGTLRRYVLLPGTKKQLEDAKIQKDAHVVLYYYDNDNHRVATSIRTGDTPMPFLDDITVRVNSAVLELAPGKKNISHQFMLYHGPVKTMLLGQFSGAKEVDSKLVDSYTYKLHLNTLTDYRSAGPLGAFSQTIHFTDLLITITRWMHWLLYYLHLLVGSYGLTIILLTVIVRGCMFPISRKQAYFGVKMQEIAPELKKIKEKYPKDRQAQTEATMALYRKHNVHPLGSCLPLLMQMPIFLGLYYALQESIHFRLAGFLWIDNLAAPDMLAWWSEAIPIISNPDNQAGGARGFVEGLLSMLYLGPFLNILPIFAVSFMIVQQKMMTPPAVDEQQEMQQKMMKYMMAFMGLMFYKVASGLCIYFIASSLWGLAERKLLPKKKMPVLTTAGPGPVDGKPNFPNAKGKGSKGKIKKEEKTNGTMQKVKDWWENVLKEAKKK